MAHSLLFPNPSTLQPPFSSPSPRLRATFSHRSSLKTPFRAQRCRLLVLGAANPSGGEAVQPSEGDTKVWDVLSFALGGTPIWASWGFGAIALLALPFYRRVRMMEGKKQSVLDGVEKVAEETEKIWKDVANDLPAGQLKEIAVKVEKMAQVVDKDAQQTEALVKKVDEVADEIDAIIEPMIEGMEKAKCEKEKGKKADPEA